MWSFLCVIVTLFLSSNAFIFHQAKMFNLRTNLNAQIINENIDKENSKVVTKIELNKDDKPCVMCRCWKSATFPNCDGAHAKHNEETGDNVGPLIMSVKKE